MTHDINEHLRCMIKIVHRLCALTKLMMGEYLPHTEREGVDIYGGYEKGRLDLMKQI